MTQPADAGGAGSLGDAQPSWTEGLSEEQRGYVQNKAWKDPGEAVESYRNLERLQRVPADRLVSLPENVDDPSAWDLVWEKIGRPGTAEEYQFPEVQLPDGAVDLTPKFKEWAHSAGLNQKQATALFEAYNTHVQSLAQELTEQESQQVEVDKQSLKKKWGAEYDANVAAARRFEQAFLSEQEIEELQSVMGLERLAEMEARIGRTMGEARFAEGEGGPSSGMAFGMTPEAAKSKIMELSHDGQFQTSLNNKFDPGHEAALNRWTQLHQIAYPEEG